MSRYIDADVLKERMLKYGFRSADQTITEFVEDILPTADVVEVVRCKECCHRGHCRTTNVWAVSPPDDWFCADGERREDDKGRSD